MQSIKDLEEAAKAVLKELRDVDSGLRTKQGNIDSLNSKISALTAEVQALEAEKKEKIESLNNEIAEKTEALNKKSAELSDRESAFNQRMASELRKVTEAEVAKQAFEKSKAFHEERAQDYEDKLAKLQEKSNRLAAAING